MVYELKAKKRDQKAEVRPEGQIPAVVYGPELKENVLIHLSAVDFDKLYEKAGESSLINLSIEREKEPREVLVKDVSSDPVKTMFLHVDLYQIKRGQKLEIEAQIVLVGEAPAEKVHSGILITNLDSVTIRCLPRDIVSEVKVDLGLLKTFEDRIKIKDLNLPDTVEILADLEEVVALVAPPTVEEKPTEAEVKVAEEQAEDAEEGDKTEGDSAEEKSEGSDPVAEDKKE